jgi:ribonuclease BN (tRNA processing enzyme)
MKAIHDFRPIEPGACIEIGSSTITTHALNHPGGAMAYRIDCNGHAFVFATDHEHPEVPDRGLADFARGADILYTEGQYTQREYDGLDGVSGDPPLERHGWGHSPIESCVRTAVAAGVQRLHLGHRDPRRTDRDLADLEAHAERLLAEELRAAQLSDDACRVCIPYEGQQVRI